MTNLKISKVYPSYEELDQLTGDLPRGWCKIVAEKLVQNGENRSNRYVSNVMKGLFKNINVVAAVIAYRNEVKNILNPETNS